jgi:hypothetical protein
VTNENKLTTSEYFSHASTSWTEVSIICSMRRAAKDRTGPVWTNSTPSTHNHFSQYTLLVRSVALQLSHNIQTLQVEFQHLYATSHKRIFGAHVTEDSHSQYSHRLPYMYIDQCFVHLDRPSASYLLSNYWHYQSCLLHSIVLTFAPLLLLNTLLNTQYNESFILWQMPFTFCVLHENCEFDNKQSGEYFFFYV